MFSLKLRFQIITFQSFYDMHYDAYVDVTTYKQQDGGDRIQQLIGMNTVNLSIVYKLIFIFFT